MAISTINHNAASERYQTGAHPVGNRQIYDGYAWAL